MENTLTIKRKNPAGCGEHTDQNPNWWAVETLYGFSYDETQRLLVKKLLEQIGDKSTDSGPTVTDITDDTKQLTGI